MLRSMTGFGRADAEVDGRAVVVELKSVNHRYLDIAMRLPRFLAFLESDIRAVLTKKLARGHVDVYVNYRNTRTDSRRVEVDEPLLAAYRNAFSIAADKLAMPDNVSLTDIVSFPDVFCVVEAEDDRTAVSALCAQATAAAADNLIAMRSVEGAKLAEHLSQKADLLNDLITMIEHRSSGVALAYRDKMRERIKELLSSDIELDEARLENEVAYFADHANIDEELVRFRSHIDQLLTLIKSREPAGRKLDFLVQELNREGNTIGSKSADTEITRIVIDIKAEIEKIREQVQNIE